MNAIVKKEADAIARPNESEMFMAFIERAASNPDIDVMKLEKLMDMQERNLNRHAKQSFAADFVRMKPHLPKILRDRDNDQTSSKYATLDHINQVIDPILEQYGFGTSTRIAAQTEASVTVEAILWHKDGHSESNPLTIPLDNVGVKGMVNKTNVHATASSVTYAKRVALCGLLNISTGNDVDGNARIDPVTFEQAVEIDNKIISTGADKPRFLAYMKVSDVREIPVSKYQEALNALSKKEKQNAA